MGYIDSEPRRKFWDTHELGQRKFSFKVEEKQVIKGFRSNKLNFLIQF